MLNDGARPTHHRRPLDDPRRSTRTTLAALWVAVLFLFVYVDIVAFYKPGTLDGILAGRVWTLDITQAWALGALTLMVAPILMVVLSVTLPAPAARWTNVVVGSLFVVVSVANAIGEAWLFLWLGAAVEAVLLLLVVWCAWTWPRLQDRPTEPLRARTAPERR